MDGACNAPLPCLPILPMAVARSFFGGVAIRYGRPVLWPWKYREREKSVYSKRVIREQHGFDSAVCTQTVPRSTGVLYSSEECSGLISLS